MSQTGTAQGPGDIKEYANGAAADAVTWAAPGSADWLEIIGAGSTVVVSEKGVARTITTDANEPAGVWRGPFTAFTSTTATRVRMGTGASPELPPVVGVSPTTNVATPAAMKALLAAGNGQQFQVAADGSNWRYVAASVLTDDGGFLVAGATGIGSGAFLRTDRYVDIQAAVTSATADATVLYTVPAGFRLAVLVPFWSVSVTFTTSTSGAAGLKSSNAGLSTAGDLLGGASGDLVATLVSTGAYAKGTVGAKIGKPAAVLSGADTVVYDQIAGTYTAGTGIAHVPVAVLLAPTS